MMAIDRTSTRFQFDGVRYVAKYNNTCDGCAFPRGDDGCSSTERPPCSAVMRSDGRSVIWVVDKDQSAPTQATEAATPDDKKVDDIRFTSAYGRCSITGPREDVEFIVRHLPDVDGPEPKDVPLKMALEAVTSQRERAEAQLDAVAQMFKALEARYLGLRDSLAPQPIHPTTPKENPEENHRVC